MALTAGQALAKMQKLYDRLARRRGEFERRDAYFRGEQPLRFASAKWKEYNAARYDKFADNWCGPVANSAGERVRIAGFRLTDKPQLDDAEKSLWNDWLTNNMEAQSSQGILASVIASRSSVLVWGDDEDNPVDTWERADQVIVEYDPERPTQRVAALKTWCDDDDEYATLYTPDDVWKWQRQRVNLPAVQLDGNMPLRGQAFFYSTAGLIVPSVDNGGWKVRQPTTDDTWPLNNPLGMVPIVEFQNRPMLDGSPISDIAGTMCMQDAINLLWAYLFAAADYASMPARVVMGQDPPMMPILDDQGLQVGERPVDMRKIAEDRILWLTGQNTKIAQFDAARLDVFTGTIETSVSHIAAQTRTPPHYMILGKGMVNINADGMRAAEVGAVMKAGESQTFYGPSVRETFRMNALVRGNKALAEQCRLGTVHWKDAENRSQSQLTDSLQKLQAMGFPFEWLCEQYGLTQPEVQRVLEMKQREADEDPIGAMTRMIGNQPPRPGQFPAAPPEE